MRKFVALVLAVVVTLTMVPAASAYDGLLQLETKGLKWRTHRLGGVAATNFVDSTTINRVGTHVGLTFTQADTTVPFSPHNMGFRLPPMKRGAGVDTAVFVVVNIYDDPQGTVTASADTFNIAVQVSNDGNNWQDTTPSNRFIATAASGAGNAQVVLDVSDSFCTLPIDLSTGGIPIGYPTAISGTDPALLMAGLYQQWRIILSGDAAGSYKISLTGFVAPR